MLSSSDMIESKKVSDLLIMLYLQTDLRAANRDILL